MSHTKIIRRAAMAVLVCGAPALADQFYATSIVAATAGSNQDSTFTNAALPIGGPRGKGTGEGSLDVYNLGVGGSLTLGFDDGIMPRGIVNQSGLDFTVFENAFYAGGDNTASFAELMFVSVSSNGVDFARFPVVSNTPSTVPSFGTINPANVSGFAGVNAVLANIDTNIINPFDPAVSGGDSFDLSALIGDPLVSSGQVNLSAIRYIRLNDVLGNGTLLDKNGHPIYDPTGSGNNGADVDAIAVIHGVALPEPTSAILIAAIPMLFKRRRR